MRIIRAKEILFPLIAVLFFLEGIFSNATAQLPASMVNDIDNLNSAIYEVLKIIDSRGEAEALRQIETIKPKIKQQADAFLKKWAKTEEMTDEEEIEFGKKQLEKQLYKEMMELIMKPSFLNKLENSASLKREYEYFINLLDEGTEGKTEMEEGRNMSEVLTFSVKGPVAYSGGYSVKASSDQAVAFIDENNLFSLDINCTLNNGEFTFILLAEEAKTGKINWSMESQILIQSWDEDQDEVIQLSSYYNEGTITFEKIEGVGGKVSGSFQGKFFDDTNSTKDPVVVSGRFSVTRIGEYN